MTGRISALAGAMAAAALLTGCAAGEMRGLSGPVKYRRMSCAKLDRERVKTERATNRLFVSLRTRRAFGDKGEAEILALWPTLLFLKGAGSADARAYAGLKGDYEALRQVSAERKCGIAFASDVSKTVAGADRSPGTERINQVVREETAR